MTEQAPDAAQRQGDADPAPTTDPDPAPTGAADPEDTPGYNGDGGPAFPTNESKFLAYSGMSLRDYFAGRIVAVIANVACLVKNAGGAPQTPEQIAKVSYSFADALIAERDRGRPRDDRIFIEHRRACMERHRQAGEVQCDTCNRSASEIIADARKADKIASA